MSQKICEVLQLGSKNIHIRLENNQAELELELYARLASLIELVLLYFFYIISILLYKYLILISF